MNIPKETFPGFIYLDLEHPLVAWECYRGALISSYINASNEAQYTSMRMASIISAGDNVNLVNELLFEHVRSKYFPQAVSRLKCLYAFGDEISAKRATSWNCPEQKENHFANKNLVDVGIGANRVTKVDANWITHATRQSNGLVTQDYIPNIKNYWQGNPYNDDPHWELLVDGYAIIWGTDHRNSAYQIIKNKMPDTLGILELSRIAEAIGFYLGHICPQIYRIGQSTFKLRYIMDIHDITNNYKNFIERLEKYQGAINRRDCENLFDTQGKLQFKSPDLREYEKAFTLSQQNLYGYSSLRIHTV